MFYKYTQWVYNCINKLRKALNRVNGDYMTYKNAIIVLRMIPELAEEKAIEALEKQIPKKVVSDKNIYICPNCGASAETDCGDDMLDYRLNYCDNCGQKLDWSDL